MFQGKIGFIGAGNMAEALIKGILKAKWAKPSQVLASDVDRLKVKKLANKSGIQACSTNIEVCLKAKVIVLCVKPQMMDAVLGEIGDVVEAGQTVVSIAAGVRLDRLQKQFVAKVPLIRVMPNTPALVGEAMSVISRGRYAGRKQEQMALGLFQAVGKALCLPEKQLDAVTALSGSGPAYVFLLLEALQEAGAKLGLGRETSLALALQTVGGASVLARQTGEDPAVLRQKVTSKGGTTQAALEVFESKKFKTIVQQALAAAWRRSRQLSGG